MNKAYENLTALAVFKALYDNENDIYSVLWEFVKNSIKKHNLTEFKAKELQDILKEDYGFDNIPIAVINSLIRKQSGKEITTTKNNSYMILPPLKNKTNAMDYDEEENELKKQFQLVVDDLLNYIRKKEEYKEVTEEKVIGSLRNFLLDELSSVDLIEEINAYIISKEREGTEVNSILNQIKEGFILYDGICWCGELNERGHWKYPLTLYLDMDIIFYLAGYSGDIYKTIAEELFQIVQEINADCAKRKKERMISLRFFEDVGKQIDHYFDIAEEIKREKKTLDPSQTAMAYIVNNAVTVSDIRCMRADLELLLKNKAILEDDTSFYDDEKNYINNVVSENLISKFSEQEPRYKVERYLERINNICMLRKKHCSDNFLNCRYLMVTRNKLCSRIDRDADSSIKKQYYRVISPETLTSHFWFQMNKGFVKGKVLQSVDVLAQAKILMAHQVNQNISICYEKLMNEFKADKISNEQMSYQIAKLRRYPIVPENISNETVAETYELAESSVEDMIKRQEEDVLRRKEHEEANIQLKEDNLLLLKNYEEVQRRVDEEIATSEERSILINKQETELNEKDNIIKELKEEIEKNKNEKEMNKKRKRKIIVFFGVFISIFCFWFMVRLYMNGNELLSAFSAIAGIFSFFAPIIIYFLKKNICN